MKDSIKIGVYICHCGMNIAPRVDVEAVAEFAKHLDHVAMARTYRFMCSNPGQDFIIRDVQELGLNRVVVASCSPRMHEPTFRKACQKAGINPYFFQMANIREQVSWVTPDSDQATQKAKDQVKAAIARVAYHDPLTIREVSVKKSILVIGGGIAGMQAAITAAEAGYQVYLVERESSIGGNMAKFDKTFPSLDCAACIMTPKMVEVGQNPQIQLLTYSEVESVEGFVGNFKVRIRQKPRYVILDKCTGCGDCQKVCPITIRNDFEMGLTTRHPIHRLFPQAVPNAYAIERKGIPPCQEACPAGVNVVGYMNLTGLGKFDEALALVRERMPFAAICGRICFHPCEDACKRGQIDAPLAICHTKRFLGDYELQKNTFSHPPIKPERNQKVAIIGSGPAGLSAAYYLRLEGYSVTIFEKLPIAGGMLAVGIPAYRLPKSILQAEIQHLIDMGITITTCVTFGKDVTFNSLAQDGFQAFFLATGLHQSLPLGIDGEGLDGVIGGTDFLRKIALNDPIDVKKRVIIIGGGNVAIDCARTCLRQGADEVIILYRRSRSEMPAWDIEVEEAEHEGVQFIFLATPKRLIGANGKLTALEYIRMKLGKPDASGRRRPIPIEGSETVIDTSMVIVAIGQAPESNLLSTYVAETSREGLFITDPYTLATSIPGVFAGGDCTLGPASFVQAVAHGRKAADAIHAYLSKESIAKVDVHEVPIDKHLTDDEKQRAKPISRQIMPKLAVEKRKGFDEVELGFDEAMAKAEGQRCMSCSVCCQCGECVRHCGPQAINLNDTEKIREIEVGAIIAATGFKAFDPSPLVQYGFGRYPEVYTALQFERMNNATGPTSGMIRTKDGRKPERVAIIHCVGSRDKRYRKYCSRVCCMYSMKFAHLVREKTGAEVWEFYIDMRSPGKLYEEFYQRVQEEGVHLVRGRVAEVTDIPDRPEDEGRLTVVAENTLTQRILRIPVDMVILSTALEPSQGADRLGRILGISGDADGWFSELHVKLAPVKTASQGIFLAGCCQGPKDIPDTVAQAIAAAGEATALLAKGVVKIPAEISHIDPTICAGCQTCLQVCAYSAIQFDELQGVSVVNEAVCQGCGSCAAACPSGAASVYHFTDKQLMEELECLI